jgi:hypothetical protein
MAFSRALSRQLSGGRFELSLQDRSGRIQNFYAIERDIVAALQEALLDCALETQAIAFELCAVDTGFMREHIEVYVSEGMQTFEIGWRADEFFEAGFDFYPMFVVLGTRFMPPRDPLTPAYERTKPRYAERSRELVQEALRRRRIA